MILKKATQIVLVILAMTSLAHAQFRNDGYKNLDLYSSLSKVKGIVKTAFKLTPVGSFNKHTAKVKYDGLDMELTFSVLPSGEKELTGISTSSPAAKLTGISQPLIGKDYKTVKSILGNKLSSPEDGNFKSAMLFFNSSGSADDEESNCILQFDGKGQLAQISVSELGS